MDLYHYNITEFFKTQYNINFEELDSLKSSELSKIKDFIRLYELVLLDELKLNSIKFTTQTEAATGKVTVTAIKSIYDFLIINEINMELLLDFLNQNTLQQLQKKYDKKHMPKSLKPRHAGMGKSLKTKHAGMGKNLKAKYAGMGKSLDIKHAGMGKSLDIKHADMGKNLKAKHADMGKNLKAKYTDMIKNLKTTAFKKRTL
jgi:hypothetical protein